MIQITISTNAMEKKRELPLAIASAVIKLLGLNMGKGEGFPPIELKS